MVISDGPVSNLKPRSLQVFILPPKVAPRSQSVTCQPRAASRKDAASPPSPPPMITALFIVLRAAVVAPSLPLDSLPALASPPGGEAQGYQDHPGDRVEDD